MRPILFTLLALVAVAFLTRCNLQQQQDQARRETGTGQIDVLAFSNGPGHDIYPYLGSQNGLNGVILFGPLILRHRSSVAGVRVAFFTPDLTFDNLTTILPRDDPEAMADLRGDIAKAPPGTVIAMVSHGDCSVPIDGQAGFNDVLTNLDALGRPHHEAPVSWSFITVRMPWGWSCLAESFSRSDGVMTAFGLTPGWEHYRRHVPERLGLDAAVVTTGR